MPPKQAFPAVMAFSGNDPTGGAGIQADIEALASMGCHAAPVITSLTIQDTQDIQGYVPIDASLLVQQARAVLEDMPIAAFKIGMLSSVEVIEAVHTILTDYSDIPVVLDPVLVAGGGSEIADEEMIDAITSLLLPQATILTPNSIEARILAHEADSLDACAQELLEMGCEYVLVTGTHEATTEVTNTLYGNRRKLESFTWDRLPETYHGSGCTLASAIAGLIAQGMEPFTAVHEAQEYTWEALRAGYRLGMGQHLPNRFFWARDDAEEEEEREGENHEDDTPDKA
ncbi:MAG: bifunctional hydroxymethylpyrimidine kinase/phosphomethylpyrimidine kinase [Gammaproteobacteria bacterium]|nr:bifunctional hydroxymethylpyrimidine kinase/phosphomethylpyrimidine kinase [Gammaproteobacteria bacterium]